MLIENTPGLENIALAAFARNSESTQKRPSSNIPQNSSPLEKIGNSFSDSVEISQEAKDRSGEPPSFADSQDTQLNEQEQQELRELKQRDREVRAHEQAHRSGAGQYIRGGTKYEYQRGPDGQLYAVGGEVQIDTSKISGDPEATIRKMRAIRSAALAPSNPSPADRRVAAEASRNEAKARADLQNENLNEIYSDNQVTNSERSERSIPQSKSEEVDAGAAPRGSILPFLNNQRFTIPGEVLNIFA